MKGNILNKSMAIAAAAFLLTGCKVHKQIVATPPSPVVQDTPSTPAASKPSASVAPVSSANATLAAVRASQLNYNTFSGKAKAKLNIDGDNNDATLNIRIQHDHKIWVSITYLIGIEVARAQITPDSIIVINRLQGVYLKKPFSYVYQYSSRQVNFRTLEALLTGNAIPETLTEKGTVTTGASGTTVTGNMQDLVYKLIIGADMRVSQTSLTGRQVGQSLQVTNSNLIPSDNRFLPSQIDIASEAGNKKIQANLRYSNVEFNRQLEFPFSIPARYTPVD